MTTPRDFVAAMVRRPDDAVLPLVYADFLEEAGQTDRAEWVRVGQALRAAGANEGALLVGRRRKLWRRVRPAYWSSELGPETRDPAAFARVNLEATPRAMSRLAAAAWPARALAEGWLGEVRCREWRHAEGAAALWRGAFAGVPLALDLANLNRDAAADCDVLFARLAGLGDLTRLSLAFVPSGSPAAGPPRPSDGDLLRLAALANLQELKLHHCPAVTLDGITALRAAIPGLTVRLNGTLISDERTAP